MTFSVSFAGVRVSISPSDPGNSANDNFSVSSVRHLDDGRVEVDVRNFSGTIVVSEESLGERDRLGGGGVDGAAPEGAGERDRERLDDPSTPPSTTSSRRRPPGQRRLPVFVRPPLGSEASFAKLNPVSGATPEEVWERRNSIPFGDDLPPRRQSYSPLWFWPVVRGVLNSENDTNGKEDGSELPTINAQLSSPRETLEPHVRFSLPQQTSQYFDAMEEDGEEDEEEEEETRPPERNTCACVMNPSNTTTRPTRTSTREADPDADVRLHEACASAEAEIGDLRELLMSKPELASVRDEFGDFPAHVFANNDSFIYNSSEHDVQTFIFELYAACPSAFWTDGYDNRIPFAGTIGDWIDACHQVYSRDSERVYKLSEINTLARSTRVINAACSRQELQKLVRLPSHVSLSVKVLYAFKMLSFVLDTLSRLAFENISTRREFWAVASKRRDKIIVGVASLPFVVRTILLVDNREERAALIDLSIVRNVMFRKESVGIWLVALLSGSKRARACATDYLSLVSTITLSGLVGRSMAGSETDTKRFHHRRRRLYAEIRKLGGFLPCMLHLGDSLYDAATKRAVKYIVACAIGRPLPVYMAFMEMFLLLILMTSYRILVELVHVAPSEEFLSQHREFWVLAVTIAVFFAMRDLAVLISLSSTEEKLALRYTQIYSNMIGYITTTSVIIALAMLHATNNVEGWNLLGIVPGLLWWMFLLHVKGMSRNLSTLLYTIMQVAAKLKYFMAIFLIAIFVFADMIDIVKKTTGECENIDEEMNSNLETFCSLTPLQSYLAMYGIMIGGVEISSLEGSSVAAQLLFVAASFCGIIVLVNILIAIVTGEYEKAQENSSVLFARAQLVVAVRQVAREKAWNTTDGPNSGIATKLWCKLALSSWFVLLIVVEVFLIKSLRSCSSLNKEGILGDFHYVSFSLCAVLYNVFMLLAFTYAFATSISDYEGLRWLKGSKFHIALLNICLKPVHSFLSSVGLGKHLLGLDNDHRGEEDGRHPLSYDEFAGNNRPSDLEDDMREIL